MMQTIQWIWIVAIWSLLVLNICLSFKSRNLIKESIKLNAELDRLITQMETEILKLLVSHNGGPCDWPLAPGLGPIMVQIAEALAAKFNREMKEKK